MSRFWLQTLIDIDSKSCQRLIPAVACCHDTKIHRNLIIQLLVYKKIASLVVAQIYKISKKIVPGRIELTQYHKTSSTSC